MEAKKQQEDEEKKTQSNTWGIIKETGSSCGDCKQKPGVTHEVH